MAIDAKTPGSPGWWMNRLATELQREQRRFRVLNDYAAGRPPLAWGSEDVTKGFYRFQRMSRTNFASVVENAPCERISLRSVSSSVDDDVDGDKVLWRLITANDLEISIKQAAHLAKRFGRSYLATASPLVDGGPAVITVEDPRQMITAPDPVRPLVQRAAFKAYYDPEAQLDVVILWLPGRKWVATRQHKGPTYSRRPEVLGVPEPTLVRFIASSFTMAPLLAAGDTPEPGTWYSEEYEDPEIPVDLIENQGGVGEFEQHTDLLDRIHHMILQRLVIATHQAFRQRGIKQSEAENVEQLAEKDEAGHPINYNDVFESGPDALWILPPGADIWESGQADLNGILQGAKDDILQLSSVSRTPMSMFTPDAVSQSAEGAQLTREGLVFKVEDFTLVAGRAVARALARASRYTGDKDRGDAADIAIEWRPADRPSLAEMGSAASQVGETLTWEQTQAIIWGRSPAEIARAKAQRADDLVIAQQMAALAQPKPAQQPAPAPQPQQPQPRAAARGNA